MPSRYPSRVALAVLILLASGCARRESLVESALRTKTLYVGNFAEPKDLDPQITTLATDFNIGVALFEALVFMDHKTGQPVPGVAERWEFSADRLTCTFHLRAHARWSNGDSLTAHDFVYSFHRMLSPALGAEYAYMLWPIRNAEAFTKGKVKDFGAVGVAAPDDRQLRLTLGQPTPHLLSLAAHQSWAPVHRATIEKFGRMDQRGTVWTRPGNLVSNGPFMLSEWRPNSHVTVVRNPHYWGAAGNRLNAIVFRPIEHSDAEERDFRAGQLHITHALPLHKVASYRTQPGEPARVEPRLCTFFLTLNVTRPPFDRVELRRALALALNRKAITKAVSHDVWTPASALTPPGCGDYVGPAGLAEDADEARRILSGAGHSAGKGMAAFGLRLPNEVESARVAEILQACWQKELGLTCTLEPMEQKTLYDAYISRNYEIGISGWSADYYDPTTFLDLFRTGNGNNHTGWSNRDYDELLDRAAGATGAVRNELLRRAEALLLSEAPCIPLYIQPKSRLVHPTVRGWTASPLDVHRYQDVDLQP